MQRVCSSARSNVVVANAFRGVIPRLSPSSSSKPVSSSPAFPACSSSTSSHLSSRCVGVENGFSSASYPSAGPPPPLHLTTAVSDPLVTSVSASSSSCNYSPSTMSYCCSGREREEDVDEVGPSRRERGRRLWSSSRSSSPRSSSSSASYSRFARYCSATDDPRRPWLLRPPEFERRTGRRWAHSSVSGTVPVPSGSRKASASASTSMPSAEEKTAEQTAVVVNPYTLIQDDMSELAEDIRTVIQDNLDKEEVKALSVYHFDGQGKAIRPLIVLLTARCVNHHIGVENLSSKQRDVAMIAEMIHTASLIHDDVIDESDVRRGRPTLSRVCGQKKAILIGDCVLAIASLLLARISNAEVYRVISQVLCDLVQGEFMQMANPALLRTQAERFAHYLEKTYKKTACLMARPCEAVGILAPLSPQMRETTYLFGRNLGMAFQLVDDLLDFRSDSAELGKPAVNDLRSGIATGPVLFAAEEHPELYEMMNRKFQKDGDVDRAHHWIVNESEAMSRTEQLARSHAQAALRYLHQFADSPYRRGLEIVVEQVLTRTK